MSDHNVFTPEDRIAIETTTAAALAIANGSKDWDQYCELFYAPDAIILLPNLEPVIGRPAIVNFIKEAFPGMTSFDLRTAHLEGSGDIAYVRGTYHLEMTTPGGPVADHEKFVLIWKRQDDGKWRTSLYMATPSPPTA
jgi:ketosteroid isomerase-like protein